MSPNAIDVSPDVSRSSLRTSRFIAGRTRNNIAPTNTTVVSTTVIGLASVRTRPDDKRQQTPGADIRHRRRREREDAEPCVRHPAVCQYAREDWKRGDAHRHADEQDEDAVRHARR